MTHNVGLNPKSTRTVLFLLFATSICQAEAPLNELSEAERRSGWQLLFDGKTTNGWRNFRKEGVSNGWTVEDGVLTRNKDWAGDLITKKQFDKFELSLEYRIQASGNSGVMFHVTEENKRAWHSGPEVQLLDNGPQSGTDDQKAGWLYDLYKPAKPSWAEGFEKAVNFDAPDVIDATRPAGEWNHLYLLVAEQSQVVVNGLFYFSFEIGSDQWKERVAASKFAKYTEFGKAAQGHICLQDHGDVVSFRNLKVREFGEDGSVPDPITGQLPLKGVTAFPLLKWEDWESVDEQGRIQMQRPLVLTHAGDGTNRIFVAMQGGRIYVLDDDPAAASASVFLDLTGQVEVFSKSAVENEEGLLGLAFHPDYGKNGQFYIYYTSHAKQPTSVISRFNVSADDPNKADPESEEVLLEIEQPFTNHNGGSIAFGPDGYLYIGLGDGGYRNDPLDSGQTLSTLLGSILRIDVDSEQDGTNYGIPPDNPLVRHALARPEIYAYGFRNVWRLDFDRDTGDLWAADIGQDLWEEINLVEAGGNYGWSRREGTHLFGPHSGPAEQDYIDPIWEYDHQIGKSITGGTVYRGSKFPELQGYYVYGDYVSGKVWALEYDAEFKKVTENKSIETDGLPVYSFGEDEKGEIYYMTESSTGQGIYRIAPVQ